MSYTLIQTVTLTSSQASISFNSIPATFDDLVLVGSLRCFFSAGSPITQSGGVFINSLAADTTTRRLLGNGSSASSGSLSASEFYIGEIAGNGSTSNTFSSLQLYIPNYKGSQQKSLSSDMVSENNATQATQFIAAGLCTKTAAVTSLTLRIFGAEPNVSLVTGTSVSLYGVTRGSSGGVVVS